MNYLVSNYVSVLKKYAVGAGRARRKEYWMFFLANFIIGFVAGFVGAVLGVDSLVNGLVNVYQLAILVPSIALAVRRMHDTNRSGWYILIPVYGFILTFFKGDAGPNRFGPDPKAVPVPTPVV